MNKDEKIFVAGHRGLVGSAITKKLQEQGFTNLLLRTSKELDLEDQQAVAEFFANEKPEFVFLAAARVGGILANNTYRADFIYSNLQIQNNVIHYSYVNKVKKLMFLGSSCIYPRESSQPMSEDALLTNPLEYTNEPYAVAKIAGIKLSESYNIQYGTNYISVMPTNLYGPNDNFDLEKAHVLPALLRKIHLAHFLFEDKKDKVLADLKVPDWQSAEKILDKFNVSAESVEIWGSGKPRRELMYSEDMAEACIFLMQKVDFNDLSSDKSEVRNCHINIGTGEDISIKELAELVKKIVGYKGKLVYNTEKPDGTMRKLMNVSKLHSLGWRHKTGLEEGIKKMYEHYLKQTGHA